MLDCDAVVTELHVAAYSASADRGHVFLQYCLVVVAVTEEAAAAARNTHTHNTHSHTPSLSGRENAQRARVEEGVACMGELHNVERGRKSGAERDGAQARERERTIEQPTADDVLGARSERRYDTRIARGDRVRDRQ